MVLCLPLPTNAPVINTISDARSCSDCGPGSAPMCATCAAALAAAGF